MMVVLLRSCLSWPGWVSGFLGVALVTVAYPGAFPFRSDLSWDSWAVGPLACLTGGTWLAAALGSPVLAGSRGSLLPVAFHLLPVPRWRIALSLLGSWAVIALIIQALTLALAIALPWSEPVPPAPPTLAQALAAIGTAGLLQITLLAGVTLLTGIAGPWAAVVLGLGFVSASWVLSSARLLGAAGITAWAPGALLPIVPLASQGSPPVILAPLIHAAAWCLASLLLMTLSVPSLRSQETS